MKDVARVRVVVLSLLALLVTVGAQATHPAPAAAAAPACLSWVVSAGSDGRLSAVALANTAVVGSYSAGPSTLPYRIRSITTVSDATLNGTEPTGSSLHLALTESGDLYQLLLRWDHRARTVQYGGGPLLNATFDGFREISYGVSSGDLYAVHQDGRLYRYDLGEMYQPLTGTVVGKGWTGMTELTSPPLNQGQKYAWTDTLLAVQSRTGQLMAYTFDRDRPVGLTSTVLGQRGWAPMRLVEDRCARSSVIAINRGTGVATLYRAPDPDSLWTSLRTVRQVAVRWWAVPLATA